MKIKFEPRDIWIGLYWKSEPWTYPHCDGDTKASRAGTICQSMIRPSGRVMGYYFGLVFGGGLIWFACIFLHLYFMRRLSAMFPIIWSFEI